MAGDGGPAIRCKAYIIDFVATISDKSLHGLAGLKIPNNTFPILCARQGVFVIHSDANYGDVFCMPYESFKRLRFWVPFRPSGSGMQ